MKLILNTLKFEQLQGGRTDVEMASLLGLNRCQLWRAKNNINGVGEKFIAGFKRAFPDENMDEFFLLNPLQESDSSIKSV